MVILIAKPGEEHIANVKIEEVFVFLDRFQIPFSTQLAVITQIGPGIVYLEFDTIIGKLIAFETVTPIGPLHQQTDHTIYAEFKIPRLHLYLNY